MKKYLSLFFIFFVLIFAEAQTPKQAKAVAVTTAKAVPSGPLSKAKLIPPRTDFRLFEEEQEHPGNKIVPGKGLPKYKDPVMQSKMGTIKSRAPIRTFTGATTQSTPSDPTGALGPNYYVNAWNTAFAIWDKQGNQVVPPASLESIGGVFAGEDDGDPTVIYDEAANRFVIMQFSTGPESPYNSPTPGAFLIAVSKGPDPVNDGWYTYRFNTGITPDYPKISVWSDGYYITTNSDPLHVASDKIPTIFTVERDKMLKGEDAQMVSFPLPGINNNGFYSPAGFHVVGPELPPPGNSPIIYFQDDAWQAVNEDHLKIWLINVKWKYPFSSTIELSQELGSADGVSPFVSNFDEGEFKNLSQPSGPDIDALQGAVMYMTQYRRFSDHNSVVLNFVVDTEPSEAEHAGIRWYELRQSKYGQPWTVYQEGTYAPDDSDRFCGSIALDIRGNIGLGYTVLNDNPNNPVYPSLRYTGRYADDSPGRMTLEEQSIYEGKSPDPFYRYGDYAHLYVDPSDGITFWHNGEVFEGSKRVDKVGVFRIGIEDPRDLSVVSIISPKSSTLTDAEKVTVKIRNYGTMPQSNYQVSYTINGQTVTQTFNETINPGESVELTFDQTLDLSQGTNFTITASVNLENDINDYNDSLTSTFQNLPPKDVAVTFIAKPVTGLVQNADEEVTVIIENLGGEPQSQIPLDYRLGLRNPVKEVYQGVIGVGEEEVYTFSQKIRINSPGNFILKSETNLEGDANPENDATVKSFAKLDCIPDGSDCSYGDGISYFELGEIINERIPCTTGYADFIGLPVAELDRSKGTFTVTIKSEFAEEDFEKFSMWIDLNDNALFESNERVISSEVITAEGTKLSYEFQLPANAPLGEHLLRIRAGDTRYEGDLNDPCDVMDYGTTHDYTILLTDSKLDLKDSILNDSNLVVVSEGNNKFRIIMETVITEPLNITIYDMLGQRLVYDQMEYTGIAQEYELDMSYVPPGVYLVRVGTEKAGKVKRFIVK
ncbi:GEVED domain-containing protein [Christiangramia fulva]|nr:GEVED domain-containing protein [Christiangramia fulva]